MPKILAASSQSSGPRTPHKPTALPDTNSILAIATDESSFSFRVPSAVTLGKVLNFKILRRYRIQPAVFPTRTDPRGDSRGQRIEIPRLARGMGEAPTSPEGLITLRNQSNCERRYGRLHRPGRPSTARCRRRNPGAPSEHAACCRRSIP